MNSEPPILVQLEAWPGSMRVTLDCFILVKGVLYVHLRVGVGNADNSFPIVFILFAD